VYSLYIQYKNVSSFLLLRAYQERTWAGLSLSADEQKWLGSGVASGVLCCAMNNVTQALTCAHCGTSAATSSIFCKDCGKTLVAPTPLVPFTSDVYSTPRRKRTLLKWSVFATVVFLSYFIWQCGSGMSAGARLSDDAVRHFHSQLDSGAYDDILSESDEQFWRSGNREEIVKFLTGVHSKLGLSHGFTRTNIFVNASTSGTFIKVTYESTFDQGGAVETFTWKKEAGRLRLVSYQINSNIFIVR
jgi:hypothetical protein